MRRYWLPRNSILGDEVRIRGDILHHIRDVCRMRIGNKFEVIPETGSAEKPVAYLVEIVSETKSESVAQVLETRLISPLPEPHIYLALSIPRFPVFEAVIEKSVEMGVKGIHPFFSDYSFIRTNSDVLEKKKGRFEKIVQSATQQSGRGELMSISEAVPMKALLERFNRTEAAGGLFAYEGKGSKGIQDVEVLAAKEGVEGLKFSAPREVWFFVGGEGGFSESEVLTSRNAGLTPVTLGSQVLRVETACVAMVSIIKYGLDLMR